MNSRAFSLLWATPFLLFTIFPFYGAYQYGLHRPLGLALATTTVAFIASYLTTWITNPVSPHPGPVPRVFWLTHALLLGLQFLGALLVYAIGSSGGSQMLGFPAAAWALQAPRRLVAPGMAGLFVIALGEHLAFESGWFLPFAFLGAAFSTVLSRFTMDAGMRQEARNTQLLALARERERDRISADLHDILGHTLTGMTIKADLVKRLLEKDRPQEAHAQVSELLELSRSALTEVRAVVTDNRQLNLDEEIASAATLLAASGVDLQVHREGTPPVGMSSTLIARVIREGTTNIVVHSKASRAVLTLRHNGVELRNNGYSEAYSRKTRGAGSGLDALAERTREYGRLSWGREANWWVLSVKLDEAATPLPTTSTPQGLPVGSASPSSSQAESPAASPVTDSAPPAPSRPLASPAAPAAASDPPSPARPSLPPSSPAAPEHSEVTP
ncbi:sensor histidine kinase [Schaalia canis]|nr:histidine kinase [Schaalia canis]